MKNSQYILLMKAGPYCGYPLEEIIKIKKEEEKKVGEFYWGYSGVFCRPLGLHSFVNHAQSNNQEITVMLSETDSAYTTEDEGRFTEYSRDKNEWCSLSDEVLLVGNIEKPHFAIAGKNLSKNEFDLDISKYCLLEAMFPNPERYLDTYFRYRVDKACGYFLPREGVEEKIVKVNYTATLTDPYSVFIR